MPPTDYGGGLMELLGVRPRMREKAGPTFVLDSDEDEV